MPTARAGYVEAAGAELEFTWIGPPADEMPTLVFLHEGLGCVALWNDFPQCLAAATGLGALVFSRQGYGGSDPAELPRPADFMEHEACAVLPDVLRSAAVRNYFLIGHSDGASIALIFAAQRSESREGLLGLCLEAPHVFVEDVTLESIAAIGEAFRSGDLGERLRKYHGANVDGAFWGWNRVWLDPAFRDWNIVGQLGGVDVPVQVIQGRDDAYGTLEQVTEIEQHAPGFFEKIVLDQCGHTPHRDQPERVVGEMTRFIGDYSADLAASS